MLIIYLTNFIFYQIRALFPKAERLIVNKSLRNSCPLHSSPFYKNSIIVSDDRDQSSGIIEFDCSRATLKKKSRHHIERYSHLEPRVTKISQKTDPSFAKSFYLFRICVQAFQATETTRPTTMIFCCSFQWGIH